jgi:hypothetical protein
MSQPHFLHFKRNLDIRTLEYRGVTYLDFILSFRQDKRIEVVGRLAFLACKTEGQPCRTPPRGFLYGIGSFNDFSTRSS